MLGRISYETNGYRDRLAYRTNKITPTITTQAISTVEGRAADESILPGWAESYCVPGSSVRTILPSGYSTCPMYYRGVTQTVQEIALRELMETIPDDPVRTPTNPYSIAWNDPVPTGCMKTDPGFTGVTIAMCQPNKAEIERRAEIMARAQKTLCPPSCPEGYSKITGKLLPGWIQPQCIQAPCPAMYVGDKEDLITEIFEMPDGLIVGTDDDGEVIVAAKKKPNWLPLALAAGAAYFFMM